MEACYGEQQDMTWTHAFLSTLFILSIVVGVVGLGIGAYTLWEKLTPGQQLGGFCLVMMVVLTVIIKLGGG